MKLSHEEILAAVVAWMREQGLPNVADTSLRFHAHIDGPTTHITAELEFGAEHFTAGPYR